MKSIKTRDQRHLTDQTYPAIVRCPFKRGIVQAHIIRRIKGRKTAKSGSQYRDGYLLLGDSLVNALTV